MDFAVPAASSSVALANLPAEPTQDAAPPAIAAAEVLTPPPGPPVNVRNPFDASEVFEFPPGTTQMKAWDGVREKLLQRARERRDPPPKTQ